MNTFEIAVAAFRHLRALEAAGPKLRPGDLLPPDRAEAELASSDAIAAHARATGVDFATAHDAVQQEARRGS